MKIKLFITLIYSIAGLLITAFSAFMTYIIIGAPIGKPMVIKIVFTVLLMLPIIGAISYLLGNYLSTKFDFIQNRLGKIKDENFMPDETQNSIHEINEINQAINFLANKLDNLITNLKQKNQNLSDMLISMAHDIKTPLTILNGYLEEIEDGFIPKEELPAILTHMKNEIKYLNELTTDMLEFISSMQNGKNISEINLYEFINNEILSLLPSKKNIKLTNLIDDNFTVEFNKTDLKKVCINLLSNALRYTKEGEIKIYNQDKNILFENNGEKIEEKYRKKIFEPFFTISKSKNRKISGFGLGLSIVKNLCKNNNHDCYLKENRDEKTIFVVATLK